MAGGFDQQAESAKRLSGALQGVEANALALAAGVATLKTALHALSVSWAMKEIELTAQAFYKLRLSLGVTTQGAQEYVKAVTSMTKANVTNRRALIGMFEELRKGSGLVGVSNKELAVLSTRLQKEFPQAAQRSAQAIAEMSEESTYFQMMMSKSTDSATAFAMANAKWGSEYARILIAARGETGKFEDSHRSLLTAMAETQTAVQNASQSMSEAFKTPTLGVLGVVKLLAQAVDLVGQLGGGQVGKALGPIAAAGAMYGSMAIGKKFTKGIEEARERITTGGLPGGLGSTVPMRVIVTNPVIRVTTVGATEAARQNAMMLPLVPETVGNTGGARARPSLWQRARGLPGRAWNRIGGMQGAAGLMMSGVMTMGQYEAGLQGEDLGWGGALGAAGTGAMAGLMVGGGPIGALVGAMAGLTAAVIANTKAHEKRVDELGKSAGERIRTFIEQGNAEAAIQNAILAGGPTLGGQRKAEQDFLRNQQLEQRKELEALSNGKDQFARDQQVQELSRIHKAIEETAGVGGFVYSGNVDESLIEDLKKYGLDETSGTSDILEKINDLNAESEAQEIRRLEIQQNLLKTNQRLAQISEEDFRLAQDRALITGSTIETLRRGYTYGTGERSLGAIQQRMAGQAEAMRVAAVDATTHILERLQYGGAGGTINNTAAMGRMQGNAVDFLRLLGTSTEEEFMKQAGSFMPGATEEELRNILRAYRTQADLIGKINDLERLRSAGLEIEANSRFLMIDEAAMLLDLEQQRLDTQIQMSSALKQPLIIQAQLVEQQINATQKQISLEKSRLAEMQAAAVQGAQNAGQIEQQTLKIEQLYGQLASQVDYIRRSWEEVFTMQSMNLPSGSYILPTMTGLMEKGPAFAPFSPSRMAGGNLAGQGTYESIMGFGKASAFGELQERLAKGMENAAGSHIDAASRLIEAAEMLKEASGMQAE